MADRSSFVRSYSEGLSILVVDNDEKSRMYLSSMLQQFAYNVTWTDLATSAISMVEEQKKRFKVVIANVNMPDMDSLQFLHLLLDKDIPVILVSKTPSASDAKKAIAEGASFYLSEPIFPFDLKYIWLHAYRNKASSFSQREISGNQKEIVTNNEENISQSHFEDKNKADIGAVKMDNMVAIETKMSENTKNISIPKENGSRNKRQNEDREGKKGKEKRAKTTDEQVKEILEKGKSKKSRVVWTPQLHLKFKAAISELGDKKARPKPILEIMNVPNLTARQVASHLQKYRCQVQRIYENGITDFPPVRKSSNICGRTKPTSKNGTTENLIDIIKACSNNITTSPDETSSHVSAMPSWQRQEMDCIALIKSLDDGNRKVEVSNPGSGRYQEEKIAMETNAREDLDDEDWFNEWMNGILNMDANEMPDLDNIMKSDPYEDIVNVLKEDQLIGEPNPSDVDSYLNWITQTLLGDD